MTTKTAKRFSLSELLHRPKNEDDYDALVLAIDELLEITGADESHPLMRLVDIIGDWIEEWDHTHHPMPVPSGAEMLGYMIREHSLSQSDLPGVGSESVIAEILSGKRQLNLSQARWLAQRFKVSIEVFVPAQEEQLISKCLPHSGGLSA
ncbi:transcriptional regulator [Pseudomonas siliginis]|uniref:helix-turn-helix domain-containing protein n=1 Tax=Pseudomonas siliginis TaxID=2842346 RepID=UPI00215E044A|nr:transcriptional regulator [Pseudomonas siliginis]UVL94945.1 transcriptional regulator [Pseudomonas siliginis]